VLTVSNLPVNFNQLIL
jgi:hypothetical protein